MEEATTATCLKAVFSIRQCVVGLVLVKQKIIPLIVAGMLCSSPLVSAQETEPMNSTDKTVSDRLINLTGQIQSINQELSSQRAALGSMKAELSAQSRENDDFRRDMLKEIKALRRQNQSLIDSFSDLQSIKGKNDSSEIKPLRNYDLQTPDGKMYLGEDEYVYIKEADASIDARIDTGAAVSSISAADITEFERQGKKWYRFVIDANDHEITVEAPFVRTSTIRQSSKETTTERVVVSLTVKIGDYSTQSEFTLTDRSRMQYPLLIGRTLIQDIAVVDVSRDHIQGRNKDTFLILNRDHYQENMKKGIDLNAEFKAKQALKTGQVAYPSSDYGANLGPNSENALPAVRNAKNNEQSQVDSTETMATPANKNSNKANDKASKTSAQDNNHKAGDGKQSAEDKAIEAAAAKAQAEVKAEKEEKAEKKAQADNAEKSDKDKSAKSADASIANAVEANNAETEKVNKD